MPIKNLSQITISPYKAILTFLLAVAILYNAVIGFTVKVPVSSGYITLTLTCLFLIGILPAVRTVLIDARIFLLTVSSSVLYIYIQSGQYVYVYLAIFFVLSIFYASLNRLYANVKEIIIFLLYISFISYVGFLNGVFDYDIVFAGSDPMFLHGFMLSDFGAFGMENPGSWRFYGFSNEPGAAAAIILLILVNERMTLRGNRFLLLCGVLTFSSSFYIIFTLYVLFYYARILFKNFVLGSLLVCLIFLIFYKYLPGNLSDFLGIKLFHILFDGANWESRADSSALTLLSSSLVMGVIYYLTILLLPVRFWFMFFCLSFYRYHFLFNFLPLILLVAFSSRSFGDGSLLGPWVVRFIRTSRPNFSDI
jgi:hypothetical protein